MLQSHAIIFARFFKTNCKLLMTIIIRVEYKIKSIWWIKHATGCDVLKSVQVNLEVLISNEIFSSSN